MGQQDRDTSPNPTDPAELLDWLRHFADELRARLPESRDDLAEVERNVAFLEGLAQSSDTLGIVRLKIAQGAAHMKLPASIADWPTSRQLLQTFAAELCWPLVATDDLPDGWFRAFRHISSPELAVLVSTIRAVRTNRDPLRVKVELTTSLAAEKYAPGIWNLLEDLRDEQGGWPWLSAVLTQRDRRPPRRPGDLRTLLIAVVTYVGSGALGGIIGNRADDLFMRAVDYLRSLFEPRLARGAALPRPAARPEPPPTQSAVAEPLLIELPRLGFRLELVRVPAGEFLMGSDRAKDKAAYDEELPQHRVYLDEYFIGKYPVTVAQFAAFVRATNYKTTAEREGGSYAYIGARWSYAKGASWQHPRGPDSDVSRKQDHPVTCVSWDDALAFCGWLSEASGRSIALPSEAQWEKAARGADGRIYPWGDQPPDSRRCNFDMNVGDTTPVGRYSPQGDSPYGCADMAGNVWEWCADWYAEDEYKGRAGREVRNPTGPARGTFRVLRGGSFNDFHRGARAACRYRYLPGFRYGYLGFRVAARPHLSASGR